MTVETTSVLAGPYTTDGTATAFPFNFKPLSPDEVRVEIDAVVVPSSMYTVQAAAQSGTVTFVTAPAAGGVLYVISNPDFRQGISFSNQSAFLPASHNEANDRAAVRDQVLAEGLTRALTVPVGDTIGNLPTATDRAGRFLAFNLDGEIISSNGTGADDGLRQDLASTDGASLIALRQDDPGAVKIPLDSLLNRTRRAQAYGLFQADGNIPGTGQAVSLQKAINAASSYNVGLGGHLEIPWGLYYLDASLTVSDYTSLRGEGPRATILYNEQHPLNAPAILLGSVIQIGFTEIEGIGFRGYTAGVRVLGATDGLAFRRLHILQCVYGFLLEGLLQTTMIDEVEFDDCGTAIFSTSSVANRVTVNQCGFKNCSNSLVVLAGAEDFLFIGARFEGGGMLGKSTLDFGDVRLIAFVGGYMESTHQYAMRLVNSPGGVVSFTGFHWTGTGVKNTDLSYEWLVDGTGTIVFRDCQCTYPMRIPPNSRVEGECPGLIRSEWRGSDRRMPYRPASTTFDICKFTRPDAVNDPTNFNNLSGVLTISGLYSSADGGIFGTFNRRIPFNLNTQGSADVTYTAGAEIAVNTGSGANFAVTATGASPSMIMLRGAIAGVSAGALAVFQIGFEIEWDQFATLGDGLRNNFSVEKQ